MYGPLRRLVPKITEAPSESSSVPAQSDEDDPEGIMDDVFNDWRTNAMKTLSPSNFSRQNDQYHGHVYGQTGSMAARAFHCMILHLTSQDRGSRADWNPPSEFKLRCRCPSMIESFVTGQTSFSL